MIFDRLITTDVSLGCFKVILPENVAEAVVDARNGHARLRPSLALAVRRKDALELGVPAHATTGNRFGQDVNASFQLALQLVLVAPVAQAGV